MIFAPSPGADLIILTILSFNSLYATGARSIPSSLPAPILKLLALAAS